MGVVRASRTGGQVFYGDAFAGLVIFVSAVVLFFLLSENSSFSDDQFFDALASDAESISSSLVSAGMPANWTPSTVSAIGLTDGNFRLDASKVSMMMNMSYNDTTRLFGANANYLIFFRDLDGNVLFFSQCAFSNAGIAVENLSLYACQNITAPGSGRLVTSERLVYYNSGIVSMKVYVWV